MSKKRAHNEGTIYQRKDGCWVVQITAAGRRLTRSAKTRDEAQKKLAELKVQQYHGVLALPTHVTLDEWVEQWFALISPDLRPSTVAMYRKTLNYVRRVVGDYRLDKLSPLVLTQAFAQLQRETQAQRQLALAHGYPTTCLDRAVDLNVLSVNPMAKVKKPKWERRERRYWTPEEAKRVIKTGLETPGHWHPLFIVLISTGLRISEALALQWSDVDWDNRRVRIERALVWVDTECHIMPPKSRSGRRWVSLPRPVIGALQCLSQTDDDTRPIFRSMAGNIPKSQNLRAPLARLCAKADVPPLNVHGLRHVAAMLALEATGDAYAVQRRLGHSHIGVTLQVYGYSAREDGSVAASLDRLLDTTEDSRKDDSA